MNKTNERYEAPDRSLRAALETRPDVRRGQGKAHALSGMLAGGWREAGVLGLRTVVWLSQPLRHQSLESGVCENVHAPFGGVGGKGPRMWDIASGLPDNTAPFGSQPATEARLRLVDVASVDFVRYGPVEPTVFCLTPSSARHLRY